MDRTELAAGAWFHKINSIGFRTMFQLMERFGSMQEAYEATEKALLEVLSGRQFSAVKAAKYAMHPKDYLEQVEEKGIRYICFYDDIYPEKLKNIPDPPFGVFVKGSLPRGEVPAVAMIGSRACSDYGRNVAELFAGELAAKGVQIISGMARGIDSISQAACVKAGGQTYAVLGSGVDVCYPEELYRLYTDISKSGGIISSYAPGMEPLARNFPPRNRIISGLSDVVLVIESRKKSGTLITVDMALEQGKEVAVIPGRITDELSKGCHELIKQGATVISDVEQLLELLQDICKLQNFPMKSVQSENVHLENSQSENIQHGYKSESSGIHLNNREISPELKSILGVLDYEYAEAEKVYEKWLQQGNKGSFQELLTGLMDLELMDLCKSNKNRFSIR